MYRPIPYLIIPILLLTGCVTAELTVRFLDVGQGDAILLTSQDQYMLIDAGSATSNVTTYLTDIPHLDYLIVTHPHEDHIGGMTSVLDTVPVRLFIDNGAEHTTATFERLLEKLVDTRVSYTIARTGQSFEFGDTHVLIISPEELTGDLNADSVTILITDGDVTFLLTGDNEYATHPATILKVAHHGSTQPFSNLAMINPEIAVISVGSDNLYGHPHEETLYALELVGADILRTDLFGTFIIRSDGDSYTIETTRNFGLLSGRPYAYQGDE